MFGDAGDVPQFVQDCVLADVVVGVAATAVDFNSAQLSQNLPHRPRVTAGTRTASPIPSSVRRQGRGDELKISIPSRCGRGASSTRVELSEFSEYDFSMRRTHDPPHLTLVETPATSLDPPSLLGAHGLRLWRHVTAQYDMRDAAGTALLLSSCVALDRAEQLAERVAADGLVIRGPNGYPDAPVCARGAERARAFGAASGQAWTEFRTGADQRWPPAGTVRTMPTKRTPIDRRLPPVISDPRILDLYERCVRLHAKHLEFYRLEHELSRALELDWTHPSLFDTELDYDGPHPVGPPGERWENVVQLRRQLDAALIKRKREGGHQTAEGHA